MKTRREFLIAGSLGMGLLAAPLASLAQQQAKVWRIGFLTMGPPEAFKVQLGEFLDSLRQHGYVEGRNLLIEHKWTDGAIEPLNALASELVRGKPDVILAHATPPTSAARRATDRIPIVFVGVGDPVGSKLIESLPRPGANVTGVTNIARDLSGMVLALLKEVVPAATRVGVLQNTCNPVSKNLLAEAARAAQALKVQLHVAKTCVRDDLEAAFEIMRKAGAAGAIALADPVMISHRDEIARMALRLRIPSAFPRSENAEAGGLISYGPNLAEQFRTAAGYVHRILQGAAPGSLPVEQPTRLELVVNMKTAKALGITIPQTVLIRADRVIE